MADPKVDASALARLGEGTNTAPHDILGFHDGVVRAFRPGAASMSVVPKTGDPIAMEARDPDGLFEAEAPGAADGYRLRARYKGANTEGFTYEDPYRFWLTLGDVDLHLLGEGRHRRLWKVLGAHVRTHQEVAGTSFAVWAPN
ncbi:MAG: 1,4-alpha-glucan branching enzyme, partial [Actinobacteria bacterium]|nr:1,4-alpha-glucan branching enzyme [Actinomycetota bacterium]